MQHTNATLVRELRNGSSHKYDVVLSGRRGILGDDCDTRCEHGFTQ